MMGLKLDQLPDRKPVKLTITVSPQLANDLEFYADIYRQNYGRQENVQDLIPFMLENFINSDVGFKKARKQFSKDTSMPSTENQRKET